MSDGFEDRFWGRVDMSGECWLWTGPRLPRGYGVLTRAGRRAYAHRVALEIKLGRPLAPGMDACHTCDNPPCCNPAHLFEGTARDNVQDSIAKGRWVMPPVLPRSTRCGKGHERLSPGAACRPCNRAAAARYYARQKALRVPA